MSAPDEPTRTQHLVLALSCPDRPGIVHAVSGLLAAHSGNITESQQFGDPASGLIFMRVQVQTDAPREDLQEAFTRLAADFGMDWLIDEVGRPLRNLILVSRGGHCLADLLFRQRNNRLPIDVRGVKLIGATAHYATVELDEGPIIEQDVERRVLARAVRWHAEHRVLLDGRRTVVFR